MFSGVSGSQTQQNVAGHRHCILVASSNPYPLPTPVYRPQVQNLEQGENIEVQTQSRLSDAETVAKSFGQVRMESGYLFVYQGWLMFAADHQSADPYFSMQCSVSLSVICPKQLPKLKSIYNAVNMTPSVDPSICYNILF